MLFRSDGALNGLDGTDLIHRLDMDIHNDIAFNVQKILQHTVTEFRGENLQKTDRCEFSTHAKISRPAEVKGAGGDVVLGGQTGTG